MESSNLIRVHSGDFPGGADLVGVSEEELHSSVSPGKGFPHVQHVAQVQVDVLLLLAHHVRGGRTNCNGVGPGAVHGIRLKLGGGAKSQKEKM